MNEAPVRPGDPGTQTFQALISVLLRLCVFPPLQVPVANSEAPHPAEGSRRAAVFGELRGKRLASSSDYSRCNLTI